MLAHQGLFQRGIVRMQHFRQIRHLAEFFHDDRIVQRGLSGFTPGERPVTAGDAPVFLRGLRLFISPL